MGTSPHLNPLHFEQKMYLSSFMGDMFGKHKSEHLNDCLNEQRSAGILEEFIISRPNWIFLCCFTHLKYDLYVNIAIQISSNLSISSLRAYEKCLCLTLSINAFKIYFERKHFSFFLVPCFLLSSNKTVSWRWRF